MDARMIAAQHAATAIMSSLKLQYDFLSLGPDFARLDLAQEMGFVTGVCHRVALPRWGDSPDACCPVPLSGTEHLLLESAKCVPSRCMTCYRPPSLPPFPLAIPSPLFCLTGPDRHVAI